MMLPYPVFIALRYLKSKKRTKGISFNTGVSVGGVAVGVMALLVVLSVMSGFHEDLQNKILGANAHAVILNYRGAIEDPANIIEQIRGEPHVISFAPFVLGQVMVSFGKRAHGVFMRGIGIEDELKTTNILRHLKEGRIEDIRSVDGLPWIVIGKELASMLGAVAGDTVNVLSPVGEIGPLGMLPKVRQFRVAAVFEMGMFEYDTNLVLTDIAEARSFFGYRDGVTGIQMRLDDIYKASDVRLSVSKKLGFPYAVKDWMQMNRNLFSALKLEKFAMFVILILIVLVASFNIVSTLMMNVIEKAREIAILKTMGATNRGIMGIFMLQGLMIGMVGTGIGIAGAVILGHILNTYEVVKLPADIYYLSRLPVRMKAIDFILVSVSAILISFLSTLYPSYQAARLDPVEPLRYE